MMEKIKNNAIVLYMGILWGAFELSAGYLLHMSGTTLTGSLLMPVGIICMMNVYLKTGNKSLTAFTSVIAASVKLITFAVVPPEGFYLVVNPAVAILLEGLIFVIPISIITKKMSRRKIRFYFESFVIPFISIVLYKLCFLSFQIILKEETGAPALGMLTLYDNYDYIFTETFITTTFIFIYTLAFYSKEKYICIK